MPSPDLVKMPEQIQACSTPAIVKIASSQNSQEGALSRVEIPEHCDAELDGLFVFRNFSHGDVSGSQIISDVVLVKYRYIGFDFVRHAIERLQRDGDLPRVETDDGSAVFNTCNVRDRLAASRMIQGYHVFKSPICIMDRSLEYHTDFVNRLSLALA